MLKKLFLLMFVINVVVFGKIPQRAVSASQFTTEILLSIGAENQMAGTAFLDNAILPELEEKYKKIPILSNRYPSKEIFYSVNPDFVTGWRSLSAPANLGTVEELNSNGVEVFFMKSLESRDINDVFSDIMELGKIFGKEKNAENIVFNMKENLEKIKEKLPKEKIRIFPYDGGETAPFVVGGNGIGNTIIELAGGENIFKDIRASFGNGTWEKVLIEDPDMILIIDYGNNTVDKKIEYLKEKSPIKELDAVKNEKFAVIDLVDISAGIRNVDAVKKLAKIFHNIEIE
ncbi:ABC transporter substrate-binding protein [uncultured Fusobacterium sp.]|uniref:ABC transporter substrate-binding protein n=1 Tax=uncultured Fusobacterium sp. TaxID=159267 RepID=UPI000BBA5320|nr:ABC transporter substrate-binding protein [uncultured Fusobacterium sp.]BBA51772.1 ABC transporter periplasmic component [Fusobacterium varium]